MGNKQNNFKIIVPVYNAASWIAKCLNSVKIQTYDNYEVIIINDCSTDNTGDIIRQEIEGFDKFYFIDNTEKTCALANTIKGIRYICKNDEDIIVILDGDDWLADENVLACMNEVYQEDIWVTWGSFKLSTTNELCKFGKENWCVPVDKNWNRRDMERYVFSHLRTYKYFLFKAIREEDFRDKNGNIYTTSGDVAIALPLVEMAGHEHRKYVDKVLYCYNNENQLNDMKKCPELQEEVFNELKWKKNIYEPYSKVITRKNEPFKIDTLVWTKDRPCQLDLLLRSIKDNFLNVGNVFVRYDYTNEEFKKGYEKVIKKDYRIPVTFIETTGDLEADTRDIINNKIKTKYLLAACDDDCFINPTAIDKIVDELYTNDVAGISLRMSESITYCYGTQKDSPLPKFYPCEYNMLKWKWSESDPSTDWGYPAAVNNTIYKTEWYRNAIKDAKFPTPNHLELYFNTHRQLFAPYLISPKKTRILNIPVNQVQTLCPTNPYGKKYSYTKKELNDKWLDGWVISPENGIYDAKHKGVNQELPLIFIKAEYDEDMRKKKYEK